MNGEHMPIPEGRIDALRARGRGALINPANRFEKISLTVMGDHLDEEARENPEGRQIATNVFVDDAKSIINPVDSPDLGFSWTINPYRGCEHGCVYCYARPTHETFGLSSGLDFESRLFAKTGAPKLLLRELAKPSWKGERIVMSGITDPYQPIERELRITRGILEVMSPCAQPVSLITKNRMITRDLDILGDMASRGLAKVAVSVTTLDPALSAKLEPRASSPDARLRTIRACADAGVPVTVMVAPVIPGLTDCEIPAILKAASDAGATSAEWILLRLPWGVKEVFLEWLTREFPERAPKVISLLRDVRGGEVSSARFGERHRGRGAVAEQIDQLVRVWKKRLALGGRPAWDPEKMEPFRRPSLDGQMGLFGAP